MTGLRGATELAATTTLQTLIVRPPSSAQGTTALWRNARSAGEQVLNAFVEISAATQQDAYLENRAATANPPVHRSSSSSSSCVRRMTSRSRSHLSSLPK